MTETEPCPWCRGDVVPGTTCPKSIPCPKCHAPAGSSCKRPSGHRAMTLHADRIREAEALDPPTHDAQTTLGDL